MAEAIPALSRAIVRAREKHRCARCGGAAPQGHWHHRRSRRVRDQWTHHWTNGVNLCLRCHEWAHGNGLEARRQGFIVSQWEKEPATQPVKMWFGWVMLNLDGGFTRVQVREAEEGEKEAQVIEFKS